MSVTIINGGTQGLGEAVARRLAEDRSDGLVLAGRSAERGAALAAELSKAGSPAVFVRADMTQPDAPAAVVDAGIERFGTVTGVVNVAALTTRGTIFAETIDHFDRMMAVNARAPMFLIQAAARHMVESGTGGSIVNVGSVAGHGGASKLTSYSMSKAALAVMTKNLAFGLMRHGIRVNQVNPGWMDTESEHHIQMNEDGAPANWLEIAEAARPLGRLVKPWEVANTIAFLLSDDSGMTTGNVIDIEQSVLGAGDGVVPTEADTPRP